MISKILFYCTSHKKINYLDNFANLNLIACGEKKFDDKWNYKVKRTRELLELSQEI